MIISIDEYCKKYGECSYLRSLAVKSGNLFPEEILKVGMIKWGFDAANWAGAWSKEYAFFKIEDYTPTVGLKTKREIRCSQFERERYSMYNLPYSFTQKLNNIVKTKDGKECSRSTVSHKELLQFFKEATKEEIKNRKQEIRKDLIEHLEFLIPHKEKPIRFYLAGNDDCSYTAVFSTADKAFHALKEIEFNPVFNTLSSFSFKFSN